MIFPPVDIEGLPYSQEKDDYYLAASRMAPYKRMALIVAAFARMPDKKLVVVGDGPEMPLVRRIATANVQVLGYLDDERCARKCCGRGPMCSRRKRISASCRWRRRLAAPR